MVHHSLYIGSLVLALQILHVETNTSLMRFVSSIRFKYSSQLFVSNISRVWKTIRTLLLNTPDRPDRRLNIKEKCLGISLTLCRTPLPLIMQASCNVFMAYDNVRHWKLNLNEHGHYTFGSFEEFWDTCGSSPWRCNGNAFYSKTRGVSTPPFVLKNLTCATQNFLVHLCCLVVKGCMARNEA